MCGEGLSPLLETEIKSHHLKITSSNRGGVFFAGKKEDVIQFAIHTKFASRINLQLLHENAETYDEFYAKVSELPWEKYIGPEVSFRIDAETKDKLKNSEFTMHRTKDAVLDRLRSKKVPLPEIEKRMADITIVVRSHTDKFSIEISFSGDPVGRRGYRLFAGNAPVREPIAQAMLEVSGWKEGNTLVDPMCGSGTILIEAALRERLYGEINRFLFAESPVFQILFPTYVFNERKREKPNSPHLFGFDIDPEAVRIAKENAYEAGVEDFVQFEVGNCLDLKNQFGKEGHVVTNPPYGERIGKPMEDLKEMYFQFGKVIKNEFGGWKFTVLSGDFSLLGKFGLKENTHLSLKHANLKAKIVDYEIRGGK
ncbi:THUMP domain-containing class I SAM-dependent RNA methyltransferase [Leptospira mtsangambouensis]|uniref:THUMP domain-containing class I SAM-dependent RNA methyltransferase n=1 Tax=Leptospira mtsangambouensis TaxID=2484912 RepID=UPI003CC6B542